MELIIELFRREKTIGNRVSAPKAKPQLTVMFVIEKGDIRIARLFRDGIENFLPQSLVSIPVRRARQDALLRKAFLQASHHRAELLDYQWLHLLQERVVQWCGCPALLDARRLAEGGKPTFIF